MIHRRRIGGTVGSIAALFAAACLSTGCEPDASLPPIGDVTNLDPCGFIAPDAFAEMKAVDTAITIDPSNFVRCNLSLPFTGKDKDAGRVAVWTIFDAHTADLTAPNAVPSDRGPIHITKGTSENGTQCDATVRLASGAGLLVHATTQRYDKQPSDVDPCQARDHAVDSVVATMNNGMYTHIDYPSDSLHGYDLCGSISLPEVESTVNLTGLTDKSAPVEQDCQWRADDGSDTPPGAMVSVMIDDPKIFLGDRATIDGFPSRVWDISRTSGLPGPMRGHHDDETLGHLARPASFECHPTR
ncbi:hypothetical protein NONO_c43800 [Nocardia nova SH22a]|uniref:DUF3558 domain-containing protein n=1 Tax=Nocardia nova SH22a TaxID=1415166 RepID=W5TJ18_9NOCA|nr:hypothetical protein [Nocardia nova]AHH19164.1 hypothetical protein NONO_c43800 [Nocardia nova SH22a]